MTRQLASKITPKGTIVIRQLKENGELLRKRVVKRHVQYDTCFKKQKDTVPHYRCTMKTDYVDNSQIVLYTPMKITRLQKLLYKINGYPKNSKLVTNGKGEQYHILPPIDINSLCSAGTKGQMLAAFLRGLIGFAENTINAESARLKGDALKVMGF